jgi:hypothetical protein
MSLREDREDAAVRRLLARYPRPALEPGFSSRVMRCVRERERARHEPRRVGARLLLGAYWLAAALVSAWILGRLAWPAWVASVAWATAVAAAPVAYAIALFPERAR